MTHTINDILVSDFNAVLQNFKLCPDEKIRIGRNEQQSILDGFFADNKSKLVFLSGPPGVGKTSLACSLAKKYSSNSVKRINCMASNISPENIFSQIFDLFTFSQEKNVEKNLKNLRIFLENFSEKIIIILDEIDSVLNYDSLEIIENLLEIVAIKNNIFVVCICNTLDLAEYILGEPLSTDSIATYYENNAVSVRFPSYSSAEICEIVKSKLPQEIPISEAGLKMIISSTKNDLRHTFELAHKALANYSADGELFKPSEVSKSRTLETREKAALNITQDQKAILLAILKISSVNNWRPVSYKDIFAALEDVVGFTKNRGDRLDMLNVLCERGFIGCNTVRRSNKKVIAIHNSISCYSLLINSETVRLFAQEARLSKIL